MSGNTGMDIIGAETPSIRRPIIIVVDERSRLSQGDVPIKNILTPKPINPKNITRRLGNVLVSKYIMGHKQA
jgi:hypothetical protein